MKKYLFIVSILALMFSTTSVFAIFDVYIVDKGTVAFANPNSLERCRYLVNDENGDVLDEEVQSLLDRGEIKFLEKGTKVFRENNIADTWVMVKTLDGKLWIVYNARLRPLH